MILKTCLKCGLIETRITALINAINAAQHTWEHFLHQLIPPDGDH